MNELINNSEKRKELLKSMILKLHAGEAPDEVRKELIDLLKGIPYGEVVEVEQELIGEGTLTESEVLKFCDIHTLALEGNIDLSAMKIVPPGHPGLMTGRSPRSWMQRRYWRKEAIRWEMCLKILNLSSQSRYTNCAHPSCQSHLLSGSWIKVSIAGH
jgi:hypothetical protein